MNTWGNKIRLSIFGESHGEAIGIVIDGLEAGTKLNLENINKFIERRKAGKSSFTTSRKEKDEYRIYEMVVNTFVDQLLEGLYDK